MDSISTERTCALPGVWCTEPSTILKSGSVTVVAHTTTGRNRLTGWQQLLALCVLTLCIGMAKAAAPASLDDPWEPFNRTVFTFNEALDRWMLRPVASGYAAITPKPVRRLVSNFFRNIGEIRNAANSLLQGRIQESCTTTGRFLINTTVGIFGFLDVGTLMGMPYSYQDFGLTLAHWDVASGPYLMLPVLGPRTVRSAAGFGADTLVHPLTHTLDTPQQVGLQVTDIVQNRAELLGREGLIIGDKYSFIRDLYLNNRNFMITGEFPEDDF